MKNKAKNEDLANIEQKIRLISKNDPWTRLGELLNYVKDKKLWLKDEVKESSFTKWLKDFCKNNGISYSTAIQQKNMVNFLQAFVQEHNNFIVNENKISESEMKLFQSYAKKLSRKEHKSYSSFVQNTQKSNSIFHQWERNNNGLTKVQKISLNEVAEKIPFDSVRSISRLTKNTINDMTFYYLGMAYDGLLSSFRLRQIVGKLVTARKLIKNKESNNKKDNSEILQLLNESRLNLLKEIRKKEDLEFISRSKNLFCEVLSVKSSYVIIENYNNLKKVNVHFIQNGKSSLRDPEYLKGIDYFWLLTNDNTLVTRKKLKKYQDKYNFPNSGILLLNNKKVICNSLIVSKSSIDSSDRIKLLERLINLILTPKKEKQIDIHSISKEDVIKLYKDLTMQRPGSLNEKNKIVRINRLVIKKGPAAVYVAIINNEDQIITSEQ